MRYERALDVEGLVYDVIQKLGLEHVIDTRIIGIRSRGSRSNAIARIWGFPKIWQVALEVGPFYVIEVISENYDQLSQKEKVKTIIHEILHIPKKFSGGLRSHKQGNICSKTEEKLYKEYMKKTMEMSSY